MSIETRNGICLERLIISSDIRRRNKNHLGNITPHVEALEIVEMSSCGTNWVLDALPEDVKGLGKDESLARDTSLNFCLPLLPCLKVLFVEHSY